MKIQSIDYSCHARIGPEIIDRLLIVSYVPHNSYDQTSGINTVYWVVRYVFVKVGVASSKANRIFGNPASHAGIVISHTKPYQSCVLIVKAAGEAKRLEAGVGVGGDIAELVVVHTLSDCSLGSVDDEAWTSEMITDDAVCDAAFDHVIRCIRLRAVNKS